jgi:hypothetical protein
MKVICFRGTGKSGKSKTIKRILNTFFKIDLYPEKKDFRMSFEWNNLKVLLCSSGDSLSCMKPIFEGIDPHSYDIFICSCHPRNDVFEKLKDEFGLENIKFIDCPKGESEAEYQRRISEFRKLLGK